MNGKNAGRTIIGALLVFFGLVFLLDSLGLTSVGRVWSIVWPLVLVAVGIYLLLRHRHAAGPPPNIERAVGDVSVGGAGWELRDMHVESGLGSVHLDLRGAKIPEGERLVRVSGWIGSVEIMLPLDLPVAASARTGLGDINLLGMRANGFGRTLAYTSPDFGEAPRRVRLDLRQGLGDVRVTRSP